MGLFAGNRVMMAMGGTEWGKPISRPWGMFPVRPSLLFGAWISLVLNPRRFPSAVLVWLALGWWVVDSDGWTKTPHAAPAHASLPSGFPPGKWKLVSFFLWRSEGRLSERAGVFLVW